MKNIKNNIASAAMMVAAGFGVTSCDIDMLPLNEVVYENFWTNKDDVESVVASCYNGMMEEDYMSRLIVWGELRSDNVQVGGNPSNDIRNLLKGSIKTTNSYNDWSSLYTVINRCNVVMQEAPKVAEKDPNYTTSDLRINFAECKFIRAYSYLTLIKTFRDVPFTFEASIDDTTPFRLPQTKFEVILDSLITDIDEAKNYAPVMYTEYQKNTGRVTRAAMYTLLADLYLWRASDYNLPREKQNEYYRKCIECCDWVIAAKERQYQDDNFAGTQVRDMIDLEVYKTYGYPLIAEELTVGRNDNGPYATNDLFCDQNSWESIFEIAATYAGNETKTAAFEIYGKSSSDQQVNAAEKLMESKPENASSYSNARLFSVPSDYRAISSFYYNENNGGYNIYKYRVGSNKAGAEAEYGRVGTAYVASTASQSISDNAFNWILYRLSEVMLMRAEAEIELGFNLDAAAAEAEAQQPEEGGEGENAEGEGEETEEVVAPAAVAGTSLMTAEELKKDAYDIISAVYRRSNPVVKTNPKYAPTMPSTYAEFHDLLMNERRREFLFEGKRYFDLVRVSRRAGNTQELRQALTSKYSDAGPAVAIKLVKMDFMYLPVAKSEMKVNPALTQNSSYLDEEENKKN